MSIPWCSVKGPCGHETDFDLTCVGVDRFCCAACGLEWHVQQGPPVVYPSGWVQPGNRTVHMGTALPHPNDVKARKALAKARPASLARVLKQAKASDAFRKERGMA